MTLTLTLTLILTTQGTAEFASIKAALAASTLVSHATHVVKATGRYFIPDLDKELLHIAAGIEAGVGPGTVMGDGVETEAVAGTGPTCSDLLGIAALNIQDTGPTDVRFDARGLSGPCVVVQSTPSPWSLWDGVLRSEVVGWQIGLEDWLFAGMDEAAGRPMERVLFERVRDLTARAGEKRGEMVVARLSALGVDETRNAENDVVRVI